MQLEPQQLGTLISRETGLALEARTGVDREGQLWYLLRPAGLSTDHSFAMRTTLAWRRLHMAFEPDKFAGELLRNMGAADNTGRAAFQAVLSECRNQGAQVEMRVNGQQKDFDEAETWSSNWNRFSLEVSKGQLELGVEDGEPDADIICRWMGRFAAAIAAILPLEEDDIFESETSGYPEGALATVKKNRYERDRRNRAAAISIHGASCAACGLDLGSVYGSIGSGYIEVHHVTPVSELGPGYIIDPVRDLIPLCPNCHAIVHRRNPPFSVDEIKGLLEFSVTQD